MRNILLLSILFSMLIFIGCDDDSTIIEPEYDSTVIIYSQMTDPDVTIIGDNNAVDSIHIEEIRMLFSRIYFASGSNNRLFELTPKVFIAGDDEEPRAIDTSHIPQGTYNKVLFDIHRFTDPQINEYGNNPLYDEFTNSDRLSVIIEGKTYKNGQVTNFIHNGKMTSNIVVEIETPINFDISNNSKVVVEVIPDLIFVEEGKIIDPTNANNFTKINNRIKEAFKAYRSLN